MSNKLWNNLQRGAYAGGTAYTIGDFVTYSGSSYTCIVNTTGNLPTNVTYWALVATAGSTGSTGATGATGATGSAAILNWLGAYNAGTAYVVNDGVSYSGSSYVCILATTGNLPTNATYWAQLAAKGTDGTGSGDFSSNTATSVDSEIVVFSGTAGKTGKRATGTGIATLTSGVLSATATTGSGSVVLATSPTLVTPTLGVASATTVNKVTITAPATSATVTIIDGTTVTGPAASGTIMTLGNNETVTGIKSFNDAKLALNGSTSGSMTVKAPAVASTYVATFPALTGTVGFAMTTTEASNAAPAPVITSQRHTHTITALAAATVLGVPTSTMTLDDTNTLVYRIKDNGTARGITYNAIYRASSDLALPSTTVLSKTLYLGFKYNIADTKWDLLAVLNNI